MSRGLFRGIYTSLVDDPEFQSLHPHAKLVFYTARLCKEAGPAAIFRYYPELLARQTGLTMREVETRLEELARGNWIFREGPVLWIRNGLRYDPGNTIANPHHRKAVIRHIKGLPRVPLVAKFAHYYGLQDGIEMPSEWHRDQYKNNPNPKNNPIEALSGSTPDDTASQNGHGKNQTREDALAVLAWLNEKTGKRFEPVPANLTLIESRLKEGRPVWLLKKLVSVKAKEWPPGHEMHKYLRPATLFNATKCANYVGQIPVGSEPA